MKTYELAIETVREVAPLNRRIARVDPDLGRQLRRCVASVPLNIAEGMYSRGKNRAARLTDAMASAKEAVACLQVAEAAGYLAVESIEKPLDQLDHLVAALWSMVHTPVIPDPVLDPVLDPVPVPDPVPDRVPDPDPDPGLDPDPGRVHVREREWEGEQVRKQQRFRG